MQKKKYFETVVHILYLTIVLICLLFMEMLYYFSEKILAIVF